MVCSVQCQARRGVPGMNNVPNISVGKDSTKTKDSVSTKKITDSVAAKTGNTLDENDSDSTNEVIGSVAAKTDNKDSDNQSDRKSIFSLIVSVLALAISVWSLYGKNFKKTDGKEDKTEASVKGSNVILKELRRLEERIGTIQSRINEHESSINELQSKSINQRTSEPISKNNDISNSENSSDSRKQKIIRYVTAVTNNGFSSSDLSFDNSIYALAILTLDGLNGTYIINDDFSAQNNLIANFAYGAGRISELRKQQNNPSRVITVAPGRVQLSGDIWKITLKAVVDIV